MLVLFEVSNPVQLRPWSFKSRICRRVGWLWFAVTVYRMREDELLKKAKDGDIEWVNS